MNIKTSRHNGLSGHKSHVVELPQYNISEGALSALMAFKASERKSDPSRMADIHGPYEEFTLRKTGKLPADYYAQGDDTPWGLRVQESRSNILWQVISGVMDRHPEYGAEYMALALYTSLGDDDYAKELRKLNKSWGEYIFAAELNNDHSHTAMTHTYTRVSCPACSMLTALAVRDKGMHDVFKEMLLFPPRERQAFLAEKGLAPLLDTMIPEGKKEAGNLSRQMRINGLIMKD